MGLLFLVQVSLAAVGPQSTIKSDLNQPYHRALSKLRAQNVEGAYKELREIAFSKNEQMPIRWKALMLLSEVGGDKANFEIKKALVRPEWFMRSAGLTAMSQLDANGAKKWAYKLLSSDPALMVRMKAFEILKDKDDLQVRKLFWKKLFAKDSFHNQRSLWIRNDLALHLSKKPKQSDLAQWVKLLHEKEDQFAIIASQALAEINKDKVRVKNISYWKGKYPRTKKL